MELEILKSKIHRVTVTEARLDYIGSITIDEDLMDAAGILRGERVYIVDNNNGERLDTLPCIVEQNYMQHFLTLPDLSCLPANPRAVRHFHQ